MTSALFRHIEPLNASRGWGAILDAGTGVNSALWSTALSTQPWTGVSAAPAHLAQVRDRLGSRLTPAGRLILGDWTDPGLLAGERFDTVLADYLLGAIEGFAPYFQSELFPRLRLHVRGRLYVTGLDPYTVGPVQSEADHMARAIGRLRDAILLLAGEIPYREYPAEWTAGALRSAGFRILSTKRFGNRYHAKWVESQLAMAKRRLPVLAPSLAAGLSAEIGDLRHRALQLCQSENGLRNCFDYVIAAEPSGG